MRKGPNLLKLARKEQCLALLATFRSKNKINGCVYRVFPSGRGLHSSTFQLNLSRFCHAKHPDPPPPIPPNILQTPPKQPPNASPIPQKALTLS
jgi:hypothetical protein